MIEILDTTLRDGEQTPGVSFTTQEKVEIAQRLDALGVNYIEAGVPAMGKVEAQAIREIVALGLKAKVVAWNRAALGDLEASLATGAKVLHLSLPVSDQLIEGKLGWNKGEVLAQQRRCLEFLAYEGVEVSVGAEDSTRANPEFLLDYAQQAEALGAVRVRFCDTLGLLDPFGLVDFFQPLVQKLKTKAEIHSHNDFGMATANGLAAVRAGFQVIDTTVLGLGERAGNAPLEETAMVLRYHLHQEGLKTEGLKDLARFVALAAGRAIPVNKSVIGEEIFCHESGIHADGVLKDPKNYEPYAPEWVGAQRQIVIGKHSGRRALRYKLESLGLTAGFEIGELLDRVRALATAKKSVLSDLDLIHLGRP
ncbi:MAG: hypothetical protein A2600_12355 [Candidatus Lambdaproteobacteria bacterium RIFOXYD1_FULL_56_27]|uniref:Homocitrate synthase n=1 Tax=Candidatus Lambdaproteobacteria bacterium RIFOXYD2_FULL_56_26 TaxID=1817773 RepID=A0A1F6H1V8_9PROT|nr:MAG: hypothetical protein A2426_12475 [Candidatus Lambdaproteobacteria bacterium RIFOXYC1_FULL_56_13]OGH04378.1 MAG: hypothetical protein A2557_11055 [Candidatus Lambdaproteobacteria bacterium RIFOXYD2_FULL_56_26]OGH08161.1 MAG: hypothetical protein A2600_12355 [Candidatus Lambdaproteobacteria bacterium RIFOXYD1_FULL_56_27]